MHLLVQEATKALGVKVEERIVESNSSNTTVEAVIVSNDGNSTAKIETNNGQMSLSLVEEKIPPLLFYLKIQQ